VAVGHRRRMESGNNEAGDVGDVGHDQRVGLVGDSPQTFEVNHPRVCRSPTDDELGTMLQRKLAQALVVDGFGLLVHAIREDLELLARVVEGVAVGEMASMGEIHAEHCVAGLHPSPVPHCHFVTSTTHKTLRGPRGGIILCGADWAEAIDKAVFPGIQGGPLMHIIAAKAVAFAEAMHPGWKEYQKLVVENSAVLCEAVKERGWRIVSGGTDNHLFLVDLGADFISGKKAERWLGLADITLNKNTVPFDTRKPYIASGLRIGTPAVTTRGMGPDEMKTIAGLIDRVLRADEDKEDEAKMAAFNAEMEAVKAEVHALTAKFPLY
jgi:glycine hydroxymethyltransferase